MRGISIGAIALAVGVALSGCGKKKDADKDESATAKGTGSGSAPASGSGTGSSLVDKAVDQVQDTIAVLKEGEQLSAELYEKLLLQLESCQIKDLSIDSECAAYKALQDARNRSQTLADLAGMTGALGRKLIGHESPAVRLAASGLMASMLGTDASSQDAIVAAAEKETDPAVLRAMIVTVGNDGASNPKVGKLLIAMTDHADPAVRLTAVSWLASSWNKDMPDQLTKLADKVANDTDSAVREAACEYGGKLGDDRFLPTLETGTADSTKDAKLYAACMEGLSAMWCSYPFFENHSEKAYKLLVERLEATPRSQDQPPWGLFGDIRYLGDKTHDAAVKWLADNKWFKPEKLNKVLGEIITDPKTNWMARTGALEAAVAMGATKKDLTAWRKAYGDEVPFDDQNVTKAIDDAIAKAP